MREGHITLLYKKNDPKLLKNWRPVSLMNVDYKILSKSILSKTFRLKRILGNIIHESQSCGIKGRSIVDHQLYIKYMMDFINCKDNLRPGIWVLCLDQEKAFDRIEHNYLLKTLEKFKFGPEFTRWVQTMYTYCTSYVQINGQKKI